MTTRRNILKSGAGLAAILASGKAPAAFIKSMLAARNSIVTKSGGAKLPYDAVVEYLESTGTQWCRIGYTPKSNTEIRSTIKFTTDQYGNAAFGCVSSGSSGSGYLGLSQGNSQYNGHKIPRFYTQRNYFDLSGVDTSIELEYVIKNGPDTTEWSAGYASGSSSGDVSHGSYDPTVGFGIFAITRLLSATQAPSISAGMRLYRLEILEDGVAVHDIIPVRSGTEGSLYDRIAGQIYRNAGTGSFSYGNDK